ncbi:MAG: hypothetical protein ABIZ49_09970 [Opitutaceae bacterium]
MSLNRGEQRIFDYLQSHREERHYWQTKVQTVSKADPDEFAAAARLEGDLRRYYEERRAMVDSLREAARVEGPGRTSMKNLAELLLRLWAEPKPAKRKSTAESVG